MLPKKMKMNNHSNMATRMSIRSRPAECLSFLQPVSAYSRSSAATTRHTRRLMNATTNKVIPTTLCPNPKKYKKHQRTAQKAAVRAENKLSVSPLRNIQYRTSPSSRLISSAESSFLVARSSANLFTPVASLGRRRFRFRRRGAPAIRFARDRRPPRFACSPSRNTCARSPVNPLA